MLVTKRSSSCTVVFWLMIEIVSGFRSQSIIATAAIFFFPKSETCPRLDRKDLPLGYSLIRKRVCWPRGFWRDDEARAKSLSFLNALVTSKINWKYCVSVSYSDIHHTIHVLRKLFMKPKRASCRFAPTTPL